MYVIQLDLECHHSILLFVLVFETRRHSSWIRIIRNRFKVELGWLVVVDCRAGYSIGCDNNALGPVVVKVVGGQMGDAHVRVRLGTPRNESTQIARLGGLKHSWIVDSGAGSKNWNEARVLDYTIWKLHNTWWNCPPNKGVGCRPSLCRCRSSTGRRWDWMESFGKQLAKGGSSCRTKLGSLHLNAEVIQSMVTRPMSVCCSAYHPLLAYDTC